MTGARRLSSLPEFMILYDHAHEANWFRRLHPDFAEARQESITTAKSWPAVAKVLAYDRPDIILLDQDNPILVVEETVEVPSGHNVGQRFARIAAAAEAGIPSVYFGPYVAKKHGGITAGPRYMNVRLFYALEAMVRTTRTAVTTINWDVDNNCEVRRDPQKDDDMKEYIKMFLSSYYASGLEHINEKILSSDIHKRLVKERNKFSKTKIRNPRQYDGPPDSVEFLQTHEFQRRHPISGDSIPSHIKEVVLYNIGMNNIRSDPYTGMAMLYHYLYVSENPNRSLVLWFPKISESEWRDAARNVRRKDIKLYKIAADAIAFSDKLVLKEYL